MELIQPAEISGKIMTLIDQAKSEIIIVSPYNKFTSWKKLTQRIEKAKLRGVRIKWYIRKNIDNNVQQIRDIGIEPIEIENLHCKIYLNEQHAIVTSMNLHEYSDSSSIDIGYLIEEEEKYKELTNFINIYIDSYVENNEQSFEKNQKIISHSSDDDFFTLLVNFINTQNIIYKEFEIRSNRFGQITKVLNFCENYNLIFEPKGNYFRIDLRINYPYKLKNQVFKFFREHENELNESIGFSIDFGRQMKRLKLDLSIFDNYDYANWCSREFERLKPILINVIKTYRDFIINAVQHWQND